MKVFFFINFYWLFLINILFGQHNLYEQSEEAFIEGDYKKSIQLLDKLIKEEENVKYLYLLGLNYFEIQDYQKAKSYFLEILKKDPQVTFTNKDKFYEKLYQINNKIESQKILKEIRLNTKWEEFYKKGFYIFFILVFIILLILFIRNFLKDSLFKIKKEKEIELETFFKIKLEELTRHLEKLELEIKKTKNQDKKRIFENLSIEKDKIFNQYEFLQLNSMIPNNKNHCKDFEDRLEKFLQEIKALSE